MSRTDAGYTNVCKQIKSSYQAVHMIHAEKITKFINLEISMNCLGGFSKSELIEGNKSFSGGKEMSFVVGCKNQTISLIEVNSRTISFVLNLIQINFQTSLPGTNNLESQNFYKN